MIAYKLFKVRKDGSIGSLFFAAKDKLPTGIWLKAKSLHKKGFAFRPGWHTCCLPYAPHLSLRGRAWFRVRIKGWKKHVRPVLQGGTWYTANQIRIEDRINA